MIAPATPRHSDRSIVVVQAGRYGQGGAFLPRKAGVRAECVMRTCTGAAGRGQAGTGGQTLSERESSTTAPSTKLGRNHTAVRLIRVGRCASRSGLASFQPRALSLPVAVRACMQCQCQCQCALAIASAMYHWILLDLSASPAFL